MMTDKPADKWMQKALEIMPKHDWDEPLSHHFARALEATDKAARADERERCAQLAETKVQDGPTPAQHITFISGQRIAAAIRKGEQ